MEKIAIFRVDIHGDGDTDDLLGFMFLPVEKIEVIHGLYRFVGPIKKVQRRTAWYFGEQYILKESKLLKDREGNWVAFPALYLSPDCPYSPHDIFQDESFSTHD